MSGSRHERALRVQPSLMPARRTRVSPWTLRAVALAAVVLVSACTGSPSPSNTPQSAPTGEAGDDADIATAEALVRQESVEFGADLTSATLRVRNGIIQNPNTQSQRCDSGRLLHITMIGTFSKVRTTGDLPVSSSSPQDNTVHGVRVVADADSGEACMISVQTSEVTPDPEATVLSLD